MLLFSSIGLAISVFILFLFSLLGTIETKLNVIQSVNKDQTMIAWLLLLFPAEELEEYAGDLLELQCFFKEQGHSKQEIRFRLFVHMSPLLWATFVQQIKSRFSITKAEKKINK